MVTILYITDRGRELAERLRPLFPESDIVRYSADIVPEVWSGSDAMVFIMAAGIVVRTIAPLLKDKKSDPAVVVLAEEGRYAVSLVGGHMAGANELSRRIARFIGGEPVITTASDINGLTPIDLWAEEKGLAIDDWRMLPQVMTRFINNAGLRLYEDKEAGAEGILLPDEYLRVSEPRYADVIISNRRDVYSASSEARSGEVCDTGACRVKGQLYLRPKNLVIGIGCNSGTSGEEIESAVRGVLDQNNLSFLSISRIATIGIKSKEPGLKAFAEKYGFDIRSFSPDDLNSVLGVEESDAVLRATGARAVAEPAALLASDGGRLVVPKQKRGNVTVAVAESRTSQGVEVEEPQRLGRIFIVGIGPGAPEHITPAARKAIVSSDVVVGYAPYIELIKGMLYGKEVVSTGMTQEVDRCWRAIEIARGGRTVAVVSSGDPGVYAMAGLVFELMKGHGPEGRAYAGEGDEKKITDIAMSSGLRPLRVEVIPGVSALNAAASRLGAPLMNDFACISLSDKLTPWDVIEKRLEAAASSDFVIVLYNPRSKGRPDHINRAREIILKYRSPSSPVGIVKAAMRRGEKVIVTDLAGMKDEDIDMQTTVIVGNSSSFVWEGLMITPRGYERKFRR